MSSPVDRAPRQRHVATGPDRVVARRSSLPTRAASRSLATPTIRGHSTPRVLYASRVCAWWEGCPDGDLYTVDLASGVNTPLGLTGNVPQVSRDGSLIAYERALTNGSLGDQTNPDARYCSSAYVAGAGDADCNAVYIAHAIGVGEHTVVKRGANPAFSPDAAHLVVDRPETCSGQPCTGLAAFDLHDGRESVLTNYGSQASYSPDGSTIAFVRGAAIWLMRSDGSSPRTLTTLSLAGAYRPAWSPDGKRIGFTAFRCGTPEPPNDPNGCNQRPDRYHTFVVGADGSRLRELSGVGGDSFSWSPDGKSVVVERANCWNTCPPPDALLMSADGTHTRLLVTSAAGPVFVPPNQEKRDV